MHPVAAHSPAFTFEQHMNTSVAVAHTGMCQFPYAMRNTLRILDAAIVVGTAPV